VMIIFSPHRLSDDLGTGKVREALDAMRAECRSAGFAGLHLVACIGNAAQAKQCAAEGYDAVTCYNWPGLGRTTTDMYAPYETLVPAYRKQWEQIRAETTIPIAPLPVCGGWDSRPWHGDNNLVRYGRTPELFKRHLQDAKEFLLQPESHGSKMLLVEAWNEWGEGHYLAPYREYGFGYLDAVRKVFSKTADEHVDLIPEDIGMGPYDTAYQRHAQVEEDKRPLQCKFHKRILDVGPANSNQITHTARDLQHEPSKRNIRDATGGVEVFPRNLHIFQETIIGSERCRHARNCLHGRRSVPTMSPWRAHTCAISSQRIRNASRVSPSAGRT